MRVAILVIGSVLGLVWAAITAMAFAAFALSGWRVDVAVPLTAAAVVMCLLWLCGVAATWNAPLVAASFFAAAGVVGVLMSAVGRNLGIAGGVALLLALMSVVAHYSTAPSPHQTTSPLAH
jgi:hypothetical protein